MVQHISREANKCANSLAIFGTQTNWFFMYWTYPSSEYFW